MSHYLVKLTHDTAKVLYIRTRGATGIEHLYTPNELAAYQFSSETDAKQAVGRYEGTAWTAEIVEVDV